MYRCAAVPCLLVYFVNVDVDQLVHAAVMEWTLQFHSSTVGQQLNVRQQFVQETWLSEKWRVDNGR